MLQITEDTPPDMLAGAMDLTIHLPTGKAVKMSVERSTPMMDLLVQITTNFHLQLSGYTLQVLGMAPSKEHSDTILPFKPNTPIGTLDTQHIRVVPKARNMPVPKNVPPGHQPFESTFRLKVHLPRNQLYVVRVSQTVLLEGIMKKVCEEKNLDVMKYEFRHPGNLDEVLDPKLTLSDYAITEIYLVQKGSLSQTFSTGDIMALRKEEERKQMHNKTGGGVFNLIFRKGKSSTGSLSSDNRSISPTHSDDSRSVTPPAALPPEASRPKPPQRKRRPAPKPPTPTDAPTPTDGAPLTICHSRNSSDSSGYHEASVLSENNASLPRRPKSTLIEERGLERVKERSRSTSSLAVPGRKKKSAPPPPPAPLSSTSSASSPTRDQPDLGAPSPVVASQPCKVAATAAPSTAPSPVEASTVTPPRPIPRTRLKQPPAPRPRSLILPEEPTTPLQEQPSETPTTKPQEKDQKPPEVVAVHPKKTPKSFFDSYTRKRGFQIGSSLLDSSEDSSVNFNSDLSTPNSVASALNAFDFVDEIQDVDVEMFSGSISKSSRTRNAILNQLHGMHELGNYKKHDAGGSLRSTHSLPGFVGLKKWSNVEELDGISLRSNNGWVLGDNSDAESTASSQPPPIPENSPPHTPLEEKPEAPLQLPPKQPELPPQQPAKKQETHLQQPAKKSETLPPQPSATPPSPKQPRTHLQQPTKKTETLPPQPPETPPSPKQPPPEVIPPVPDLEPEADWQYQLPSPPKAFRDSSPVPPHRHQQNVDSVVTSPELFEKLEKVVRKSGSDLTSMVSEEDRPIMSNLLSLENLEKRKSLVYNRELATSLKMTNGNGTETFTSSLANFEKTFEEVKKSSPREKSTSTLPNFQITTYNPKKKLDIFEDDTIRSNSDHSKSNSKRNSFGEVTSPLQRTFMGRSMENISFRKGSLSEEVSGTTEYKFYRPAQAKNNNVVNRTESLKKEHPWVPTKPVTRSKSQLILNKYKDGVDDDLTKSNSLFDVSGLQSLEVMRTIQNKLKEEPKPEPKVEPVRTYSRYTPPAINMSTWSERPKIPVNVKEDPDYKFGVKETSKIVVSTINNDVKSQNTLEIKSNGVSVKVGGDVRREDNNNNNRNVNIKVNGYEPTVIKIGGEKPVLFRKPLGNVNGNKPRPHSIAWSKDAVNHNLDVSRVPIVRSVEFKKPFQNNTSVTQIYQSEPQPEPPKPVLRTNSFLQHVPVVRGFKTPLSSSEVNRNSCSNTLPTKPAPKNTYVIGAPMPFSQPKVPPAPVMPKSFSSREKSFKGVEVDPKEQLLQAIRDFGGKKGLRAVRA